MAQSQTDTVVEKGVYSGVVGSELSGRFIRVENIIGACAMISGG